MMELEESLLSSLPSTRPSRSNFVDGNRQQHQLPLAGKQQNEGACKYFKTKKGCRKGHSCGFAHHSKSDTKLPSKTKTKGEPCKYFKTGKGCRKGHSCGFTHSISNSQVLGPPKNKRNVTYKEKPAAEKDAEIMHLRQICQDQNDQCSKMMMVERKLRENFQEQQLALKAAKAKMETTKKQLEDLNSKAMQQQAKLELVSKWNQSIEPRLRETRTQLDNAQSQVNATAKELGVLMNKLDATKKERAQHELLINALIEERTQARRQCELLAGELQVAQAEKQQSTKRCEVLACKLQNAEVERDQFRQEAAEQEEQKQCTAKANKRLEVQLREIRTQLTNAQSQAEKADAEATKKLEEELEIYSKWNQSIGSQLRDTRTELGNAQSQVNATAKEVGILTNKLDAAKKERAQHELLMNPLINALKEERTQARGQCELLANKLQVAQAEKQQATKKCEVLACKLQNAEVERDHFRQENAALKTLQGKLKETEAVLNGKQQCLESFMNLSANIKGEMAQLKKELEDTHSNAKQEQEQKQNCSDVKLGLGAKNNCSKFEKRLESLKQELEDVRASKKQMKSTIEQLKAQLVSNQEKTRAAETKPACSDCFRYQNKLARTPRKLELDRAPRWRSNEPRRRDRGDRPSSGGRRNQGHRHPLERGGDSGRRSQSNGRGGQHDREATPSSQHSRDSQGSRSSALIQNLHTKRAALRQKQRQGSSMHSEQRCAQATKEIKLAEGLLVDSSVAEKEHKVRATQAREDLQQVLYDFKKLRDKSAETKETLRQALCDRKALEDGTAEMKKKLQQVLHDWKRALHDAEENQGRYEREKTYHTRTRGELRDSEGKLKEVEHSLVESKKQLSKLLSQLDDYCRQCALQTDLHYTAKAERDEARKRELAAISRLEIAEGKTKLAKVILEQADDIMARIRTQESRNMKILAMAEAEREANKAELKSAKVQLKRAADEMTFVRTAASASSRKAKSLESELRASQKATDWLKGKLEAVRGAAVTTEAAIAVTRAQSSGGEECKVNATTGSCMNQELIKKAHTKVMNQGNMMNHFKEKFARYRDTIRTQKVTIGECSSLIETLREKIQRVEKDNMLVKSQLDCAVNDCTGLEEKIRTLESERNDYKLKMQSAIDKLATAYAKVCKKNEEAQITIEETESRAIYHAGMSKKLEKQLQSSKVIGNFKGQMLGEIWAKSKFQQLDMNNMAIPIGALLSGDMKQVDLSDLAEEGEIFEKLLLASDLDIMEHRMCPSLAQEDGNAFAKDSTVQKVCHRRNDQQQVIEQFQDSCKAYGLPSRSVNVSCSSKPLSPTETLEGLQLRLDSEALAQIDHLSTDELNRSVSINDSTGQDSLAAEILDVESGQSSTARSLRCRLLEAADSLEEDLQEAAQLQAETPLIPYSGQTANEEGMESSVWLYGMPSLETLATLEQGNGHEVPDSPKPMDNVGEVEAFQAGTILAQEKFSKALLDIARLEEENQSLKSKLNLAQRQTQSSGARMLMKISQLSSNLQETRCKLELEEGKCMQLSNQVEQLSKQVTDKRHALKRAREEVDEQTAEHQRNLKRARDESRELMAASEQWQSQFLEQKSSMVAAEQAATVVAQQLREVLMKAQAEAARANKAQEEAEENVRKLKEELRQRRDFQFLEVNRLQNELAACKTAALAEAEEIKTKLKYETDEASRTEPALSTPDETKSFQQKWELKHCLSFNLLRVWNASEKYRAMFFHLKRQGLVTMTGENKKPFKVKREDVVGEVFESKFFNPSWDQDVLSIVLQNIEVRFSSSVGERQRRENGVDMSGLTNELNTLFWEQLEDYLVEIQDPHGSGKKHTFKMFDRGLPSILRGFELPESLEQKYEAVGRFMLRSFIHDLAVPSSFSSAILMDYILHFDLRYANKSAKEMISDLLAVDPINYQWVKSMVEGGESTCSELLQNDDLSPLKGEEVVRKALKNFIEMQVITPRKAQFQAISRGFRLNDSFNVGPLLELCQSPKELRLLLSGEETFGASRLMEVIQFEGFEDKLTQKEFFFQVLSDMDEEKRRLFLRFVTGLPALPAHMEGGWLTVRAEKTVPGSSGITANGKTASELGQAMTVRRFPRAQTCSRELILPAYNSKEEMEERILEAIQLQYSRFEQA